MPNPAGSGLPNAAAYDTSEPGITLDKLTRLTWQADSSPYFDDENVATYCDLLELGGHADWRVPSRIELGSILDYGAQGPLLDPAAFSPALATAQPGPGTLLSSSVVANNAQMSWSVSFLTGDTGRGAPRGRLRCVRGEPLIPVFELGTGALEGTATELTTGLVWQLETSDGPLTWQDASDYCADLGVAGFDDWRIPSLTELPLIIDDSRTNPAAAAVFPAFSDSLWTSSPPKADETTAWTMFMYYGDTARHSKTTPNFVRCVR